MNEHQLEEYCTESRLTGREGTGLYFCPVCGGAEGSLPTECPGAPLGPRVSERVYAGVLDFIEGRWVQKAVRGLVIRMPLEYYYNPRLIGRDPAGLQPSPGLTAVERWGTAEENQP